MDTTVAPDCSEPGPSCSKRAVLVPTLLCLPPEVLEKVLVCLDATSLLHTSLASKLFYSKDRPLRYRLVEKAARERAVAACGDEVLAKRFRRYSWLERLYLEESAAGFGTDRWQLIQQQQEQQQQPPLQQASQGYFTFTPNPDTPGVLSIELQGMGPKLLVSDLSTADQPVLRWRIVVRGNTAVEFGVVPLCLEDEDKALHKATQEAAKFAHRAKRNEALPDSARPIGFCSNITVGSLLHFKTAVMKGSVVELVARRGRLAVLLQHPQGGQEMFWNNTQTVPKPYYGPREMRFEQDFSPDHHIKLAMTSWAHGAFDVLHPVELAEGALGRSCRSAGMRGSGTAGSSSSGLS